MIAIDILLVVTGGAALILGLAGCLLPILPGPPLALAGLLLAYFSSFCTISAETLIYSTIAVTIVTVIDFILPLWLTKKTGGTKYGVWGATAGLIAGLFLGPFGVVIGPLAGAFIGEMIHDRKDPDKAVKAAAGSFLGFLAGTGMKLVTVGALIWIFISSMM